MYGSHFSSKCASYNSLDNYNNNDDDDALKKAAATAADHRHSQRHASHDDSDQIFEINLHSPLSPIAEQQQPDSSSDESPHDDLTTSSLVCQCNTQSLLYYNTIDKF